jgi:hypothetical protein
MTDVAYVCHNCGSVHEVESIRQNLILDLRTAASYDLPGPHQNLNPRAHFLRWRMSRALAHALWLGYSHQPRLASGRRLAPKPPAPLSDRPAPGVTTGAVMLALVTRRQPAPVAGLPASALTVPPPLPDKDHDRPV